MSERELERGLLDHLRALILELGKGFAFVGSQYPLEVGGQDYYLDLLFYHLRLRCFVVVELKIEDFKPEFAGKMNFYLSAVDELVRHESDGPTIGIILCKGKNAVVVEYALRDTARPMGVAEYRMSPLLPARLESELPTVQEFAREFPLMSVGTASRGGRTRTSHFDGFPSVPRRAGQASDKCCENFRLLAPCHQVQAISRRHCGS